MAGYVLYKSTHPETKKKLKCSLHLAYWDLRMGLPPPEGKVVVIVKSLSHIRLL